MPVAATGMPAAIRYASSCYWYASSYSLVLNYILYIALQLSIYKFYQCTYSPHSFFDRSSFRQERLLEGLLAIKNVDLTFSNVDSVGGGIDTANCCISLSQ